MINFQSESKIRKEKLVKLIAQKQNPFLASFQPEQMILSLLNYASFSKKQLNNLSLNCKIAGRIMQIRDFGKLFFCQLMDSSGTIQLFIDSQQSGEKVLNLVKYWDRGDIIGIKKGKLVKTATNQLSVLVLDAVLLVKSLAPLPEKYHKLTDVELRYRCRYLDLIVNKAVHRLFKQRSLLIQTLRRFLDTLGFMEVETPILQDLLTGAAAKPFKTFHNVLKMPLYLRVAPELYLKRLIVGNYDKVYELGRLFRNEGLSSKHNPEFTAIEIYQAYGNMETMMDLTEKIILKLLKTLHSQPTINYQKHQLNFASPFTKITMLDAVYQVTKINFKTITTFSAAQKLALKHKISLLPHQNTVGYVLNAFFEKYVEKTLIQPTFIYQYPIEISPFAKQLPENSAFTERFELFIVGKEYANAFSELNDPKEQKKRFLAQLAEKKLGNEEANEIDYDYLLALEYGMPPTGGLGIGIDRLVMLLTNQPTIKDVILFPTLKKK